MFESLGVVPLTRLNDDTFCGRKMPGMCISIMVMLISEAFQYEKQSCFGISSLVFREIQVFVPWNFDT